MERWLEKNSEKDFTTKCYKEERTLLRSCTKMNMNSAK
jgi:hypothetical protein